MNKNLNEQLWAVAKEYARQFGEVIGMEPEFWVGDTPDICCFGDVDYYTLNEMQQVIDRLPQHIRRYGSREAVGDEIRAWTNWWLENDGAHRFNERVLRRVTHQLRPNINLDSWLRGCPREERKPYDGLDGELMARENLLGLLIDYCKYVSSNKVTVVIGRLLSDVDRLRKEKDERDKEEWRRIMAGKARQVRLTR